MQFERTESEGYTTQAFSVRRNWDSFSCTVLEFGTLSGRHRDGSWRRAEDFGVKLWSGSSQGIPNLHVVPVLRLGAVIGYARFLNS